MAEDKKKKDLKKLSWSKLERLAVTGDSEAALEVLDRMGRPLERLQREMEALARSED